MSRRIETIWSGFQQYLLRYELLPNERKGSLIFRGQGDAHWRLQSTIDRLVGESGAAYRESYVDRLVQEFQQQVTGLQVPELLPSASRLPVTSREWEYFSRHHGLPTAILDWTTSPFVAAFFAASDGLPDHAFTVWMFDRAFFLTQPQATPLAEDPVEFWDSDPELLRLNPRAVEQGAVAMKVLDVSKPLEKILGSHLWRFDFPATERSIALKSLHSMRITHRSLFRSLDHAAKTATWKVAQEVRS